MTLPHEISTQRVPSQDESDLLFEILLSKEQLLFLIWIDRTDKIMKKEVKNLEIPKLNCH